MWVLCRRGLTKRAVPFHRIVDVLDISVIDVLQAMHALIGCDTKYHWEEESCSKARRN